MNFNIKIQEYFSSVRIQMSAKQPKHLTHLYADYLEVKSLFWNNNYVSSSDLIDHLKGEGIIICKERDEEQAEGNDENEQWVNSIFDIIKERENLFGDDYPFEVSGSNKIKLKDSVSKSNRHKLYLFLLLSSCLNLFKIFEPELTTEFESVCYQALSSFLPAHSTVKSFGKNSDYAGTAIEKINELAKDLKIKVDDSFISKISKKGNQDRGLDIIGWVPFDDSVSNFLSILCQCACGKDWHDKLLDTSRYEKYYRFHCNKPVHAMFIPYALINVQDSDFHQADEIANHLIFERKRILNFVRDDTFFDSFKSKMLVEECITYEEDIV